MRYVSDAPKVDTTEYRALKAFLAYFSERCLDMQGLAANHHPIAALNELERTHPTKAADGLRMAINDCLEISGRWPLDRVHVLDERMRKAGLLTLSEVRRQYSRAYQRILERGKIRSEVDYYLVKGVRDIGKLELSAQEIVRLDELLHVYEERVIEKIKNKKGDKKNREISGEKKSKQVRVK